MPPQPRPVIAESWRRSLAARVDPDRPEAPVVLAPDEVAHVRHAHPLAAVLPVLRETLAEAITQSAHVMIVTDADGRVLWCEGASAMRDLAERARLTEGARWSEDVVGTNAMGTALALGRPVTVHSAEHLVRAYHGWTCTASPVRDPDGHVLGAVDVSGPLTSLHPAMAALVSASARLAEHGLRLRRDAADERLRAANLHHLLSLRGEPGALLGPTGRVLAAEPHGLFGDRLDPSGPVVTRDGREAVVERLAEGYLVRLPRPARTRPVLTLRLLGDPEGDLDGYPLVLSPRHADVLAALCLRPHGATAERLALLLYGERGNPTTVRAELHRLRAQLGGVLSARPYRLHARVRADFLTVRDAVRAGDVDRVAGVYRAPLLPASEAPVVVAEREDLAAAVRRTVLDRGGAEAVWALAATTEDDVELLDRLVRVLDRDDPRRDVVAARLRRALRD
ncbi:GAF domain-containing protein [Saccharothrix violaceirubra]|uniref:OmpR/PhoB-type domain-containing protein n=1 Tax=Saccharothrix violaceirubra TaxID=413306 RepID=A0A7W7T8Q0_9PSEU|nr:GAF domain-containing protein [Saccharothrix violaceirubra]MBB4968037.1 hypothetical protein [Saccharothrix violaceirubra]